MPLLQTAVTGGIAEGKSTVLRYLQEAGFSTWSADEAAKEVYARIDIQEKIRQLTGEEELTREGLRQTIATHPTKRRALNGIMHGPIIEALRHSSAQFIEVPLLIETCIQGEFGRIWVVQCGIEEQKRRLKERYPSEAIDKILATQLPSSVKTAFADVIIRTNEAEENVKRYVLETAKKQLAQPQI